MEELNKEFVSRHPRRSSLLKHLAEFVADIQYGVPKEPVQITLDKGSYYRVISEIREEYLMDRYPSVVSFEEMWRESMVNHQTKIVTPYGHEVIFKVREHETKDTNQGRDTEGIRRV